MAESITPFRIVSKPGIARDGTTLDNLHHHDGQWVRWQRGMPRKMGGYRRLTNLLDNPGRGMNVFDQNNQTYTHVGNSDTLQQMQIDPTGVVSSITDRTPAAFTTSANNLWQFDAGYDTGSSANYLLAHAAPNAADISSNTATPVWYGSVTATAVLTTTAFPSVSGGVVQSGAYTWAYGSDGIAYWSPPNDPPGYGAAGSGSARPCAAKIVRALPLRAGSGAGPTTLFWSLNTLERATFVGGTAIFNFDTVSPQSSILSAASVIEYNGVYFWCGVDSFLMFNGVVRELPNDMNVNYFFDNLNYTYRSRVFAFKVPRFSEIWWCYPRGSATECTHAVIYNVRENTWYDTELPGNGRSCAQYAQVFKSPLLCGVDEDTTAASGGHRLWQHEFGVDSLDGTRVLAIESYYETHEFGVPIGDTGASKTGLVCNLIEPDFLQSGDMTLTMKGRMNARSEERVGDVITFPENSAAVEVSAELQQIKELFSSRYIHFRFGSNVAGGDYQAGKIMGHFQPGDGRTTS